MSLAAMILPADEMLVTLALSEARRRGWVLQTNHERSLMAPHLLPGFARITGGGSVRGPAPEPEAA